ncbi:MAG: 7-cyano-7-deazaguanine synthase QueC [Gammaproteobacteria bacterium]|nr:7-cyano-7-deazaguanine synthase QueC [Gammaproteobacteria bacterium]
MRPPAVVLVSGGLDSATTLAIARDAGFRCFALSVAYGQRHEVELEAAHHVVEAVGAEQHRVVSIDLSAFGGSALTDPTIAVPETETEGIPVTYVPARNTVFLSLALAWAETLDARDIFLGVNAVDYSGYPDCRPAFVEAFRALADVATRAGTEGAQFTIHAPLIEMTKAEIIVRGTALGVDYGQTISCYQPDRAGRACGRCESCRIRQAGFAGAGVPDPTSYAR